MLKTNNDLCPICFRDSVEWMRFKPCLHFVCRQCANDWLEVKHECLMCKTPTVATDLFFGKTVLLDADLALPATSRKHLLADTSDESASEALDRHHFVDEFTKLLQLINDRHNTFLTMNKTFAGNQQRLPQEYRPTAYPDTSATCTRCKNSR